MYLTLVSANCVEGENAPADWPSGLNANLGPVLRTQTQVLVAITRLKTALIISGGIEALFAPSHTRQIAFSRDRKKESG